MYKNQLQELAQRSCFNLPSYTCIREGPDHAPRFKASVNFNGEIFESPTYCSTLRQAEHAAAEVSLNVLTSRVPSKSLTVKILVSSLSNLSLPLGLDHITNMTSVLKDETGIYKNLLQETAHRAGLVLPMYTSVRSGSCYFPAFSCTVELGGVSFRGESAKTKKQAEKNAAIAAWSSLKKMSSLDSMEEEKEQEAVVRVLSKFKPKEVRRRETNQWRRRDTNKDLLFERLRWTKESSSSKTQKQQKPEREMIIKNKFPNLQQYKGRSPEEAKPERELSIKNKFPDLQQYKGRSSEEVKLETEMIISKSFPLLMADHNAKLNESTNRLAFPDKNRYSFVGGCSLKPNSLAPAIHIRSVIPVFSAPTSKTNPNLSVREKPKEESKL